MSLGVAHEISLALSASLAFLVALVGGATSPFAWSVLLAPFISVLLRLKNRAAPSTSGTIIALASLGLGGATLAQRGSEAAVLAGGYALMGLLVARLLTRTTLAHDLQSLLLSLLLVVAASVLNVRLSYAPLFMLYGVAVVWALITRELLRGAERSSAGDVRRLEALRRRTDVVTTGFLVTTSALAISLLLATSLVFVLFPRVGFHSLSLSAGPSSRLPSSVSLRGSPRGSLGSDDVIARVKGVGYEAFLRGLYLRGAVYDTVDEHGFSRGERAPKLRASALALAKAPVNGGYEVYLTPGAGTTLLALGQVRAISPISGGRMNPNDRLHLRGVDRRGELHAGDVVRSALRYRVQGGVAAPASIPAERQEHLQLDREGEARTFFEVPDDVDPRVVALAKAVVGDVSDPVVVAQRLRSFLLTELEYSLEQPNAAKPKPLASFLLDDRRGHCEYFASAFALLLRVNGVAARVVGGYQGGAWDASDDVVIFTGQNAHAWVEWFLPGAGWIVDDPTPLATATRAELRGIEALLERLQRFWDDRVLDYALGDQLQLAGQVQRALSAAADEEDEGLAASAGVVVAALAAACVLGIAWRRRRRRGRLAGDPEDKLAAALLSALARYRGAAVGDAETLREATASLPALSGEDRAVLERALAFYERRRFAGGIVDAGDLQRSAAELAALRPGHGASGGSPPGPLSA